jgi:hypothetical protein
VDLQVIAAAPVGWAVSKPRLPNCCRGSWGVEALSDQINHVVNVVIAPLSFRPDRASRLTAPRVMPPEAFSVELDRWLMRTARSPSRRAAEILGWPDRPVAAVESSEVDSGWLLREVARLPKGDLRAARECTQALNCQGVALGELAGDARDC